MRLPDPSTIDQRQTWRRCIAVERQVRPRFVAVSVVLTTERYQLSSLPAAAAGTLLRAVATGGRPPYTFRWTASNPAGEPANELLDSLETAEVRFTAGSLITPAVKGCTCLHAEPPAFLVPTRLLNVQHIVAGVVRAYQSGAEVLFRADSRGMQ